MRELTYSQTLQAAISKEDMSREQAHWAFGRIMDGSWTEPQVAALLAALAAKGHAVQEIVGAAMAMRERAVVVDAGAEVVDTCGTGGTGLATFNISTASALVAAGAGAKVAKHGNRSATRPSGSADVLMALGVKIDADPATVAKCIQEAGVGFCFAVKCHPAMKYAAPVRKALGVRTIFNVLGPLTNPAGARRQVMGVFDAALTEVLARVLGELGSARAMVVHAECGLDELSTCGPTRISELVDGNVITRTVAPRDFGLPCAKLHDLLVTSASASAAAISAVLAGKPGPHRDIVLLNAAAALVVSGSAKDLSTGIALAAHSIESGSARAALERLIQASNS